MFEQCEFCADRVMHSYMEEHRKNECPVDWNSGCPYGCTKASIKEGDLATHRQKNVVVHLDRLLAKSGEINRCMF